MRARFHFLFSGMVLLACAGCGWRKCVSCCESTCPSVPAPCREIEPLPPVPDVSQVVPVALIERTGDRFCALNEPETQCQAANNSKTGRLLAVEADAVVADRKLCDGGSELARQILLQQANHERNKDAAAALTLLLRLVEAEGGVHNLRLRLNEIDGVLSDIEQLERRGIASPVSRSEMEVQRLAAEHRLAEVRSKIDQLNYQLADALGITREPGSHYFPEVNLIVDSTLPDAESAVAVGLSQRADLAALRCASQASDREAVAAAKLLMAPLGIGATDSGGCLKLLHLCGQARAAESRVDQIAIARRYQERSVENEVRQAAELVATRLSQIAITRTRQEAIQSQITASHRRQEIAVSPFAARTLRLDALAAEQDLLHDVVEWKIALVQLKQAQGQLAVECGWCTSSCCD